MRSGERRTLSWCLRLPLAALVALAGAAFTSDRGLTPAVPPSSSQRDGQDVIEQRGQCTLDSECTDADSCTSDTCLDGVCVNRTIPGCVPCELNYICPAIEAVFVMDTSGSMRDEATALCTGIDAIVAEFADRGVALTTHVLGITDTGDIGFECLTDDVVNMLGGEVPGELAFCPFPNDISSFESWGPGTAIVAERFPWMNGAKRLVIPVSDEGPCNGSRPDGCMPFGEDRDAIDNAIFVAFFNDVVASPITGSGADDCVRGLAQVLADSTGGVHQPLKAATSVPDAIRNILFGVCTPDPVCDDENLCTDNDTCENGVCSGEPNYDTDNFCCTPDTGELTPLSDGNDCTFGTCDPITGAVEQTPTDMGTTCDDGDACTALDECDGAGGCAGTDINTFPCESDDDCFGAICDTDTNQCFCTDTPSLCLVASPSALPDETCHTVGDEITVNVELGFSVRTIGGGNFLVDYDPAVLEFLDVAPGTAVDPESPFSIILFHEVDPTKGEVSFAAGIELGSDGHRGPTTMASITFRALTACTADELCLLNGNPFGTRLTDVDGQDVSFVPCCTDELTINGPEPQFTCPDSVSVNAVAGGTTATIQWDPVSVESACDPGLAFECTASHSLGANVDNLIEAGGRFPAGTSTFTCTATDSCGAMGSCSWTVEVRQLNTLEVSLELSPTMAADPFLQPLTRCISFELFSNCVQPPAVVEESIEFGLPFNLTGHAEAVLVKVPAGNYACITARDPQHTLRSSAPLQKVNGRYVARFEGDPFFDGNWLVGGNADGSPVIDILDFGILLDQYLTFRAVDTPCGGPAPHGDFNGDGIVDTLDMSFVSLNFLKTDKARCCPEAVAAMAPTPLTRVPVSELTRVGVRGAARLDANGDGYFDLDDARTLMGQIRRGTLRPSR